MSYNNTNFSYFNAAKGTGDWWGSKDTQTVSGDAEKSASDSYAAQAYAATASNYAGQISTPTGKSAIGIKNTFILPSVMNYGGHALTTPPTYTPPPYIPPLTKHTFTPAPIVSNSSGTGTTYGTKVISSQLRTVDPSQPQRDVIQGTVTQLFSNFGFIDDNIIFSKSDILGPMVNVGDKVTVDVTLQQNSTTKYKGERVCKLDINPFVKASLTQNTIAQQQSNPRIEIISNAIQDSVSVGNKSTNNPRNSFVSNSLRIASPKKRLNKQSKLLERLSENLTSKKRAAESPKGKRSDSRDKSSENKIKSRSNDSTDKTVDKSDKSQTKDFKVSTKKSSKRSKVIHNNDVDKTSQISPFKSPKSHSRKRSPDSKAKCISKNYESFAFRELDCAAIKNQCRTLTLPSELFHISLKYQQSYPLNHPMKLGNNCHFKILDKKVKPIDNFTYEQLNKNINPQDADGTFIAKVMLISTDDLAKFYKDTLSFAEEFDGDNKIPITKAIKFLIGSMGEDKEFGIGGAWSPSLDGPNPESNPRVLINTAIRTCRILTGIDLSNCSSWPKFLELHYYRPLQKLHTKNVNGDIVIDLEAPEEWREPRMETVVYFIPDVWNIVPSQQDWSEIKRSYEEQLARLMCPPPPSIKPKVSKDSQKNTSTSSTPDAATKVSLEDQEEEDYNFNEADDVEDKQMSSTEQQDLEDQPTHFSKLTLSSMKIVDIKRELELRKLNNRGVMDQLKARLKSALEKEENEEKIKVPHVVTKETQVVVIPKDSSLSTNDKNELKKLYTLPDRPEIIVHQNRKSKHLKIRTMSLHSLLSYYNIKLEESTFELAIFAKQFLDMLRRDAVFNIYKSIVVASDSDLKNKEDSSKRAKLMVTTSKRTVNRPLLFSCSLLDREKSNKICLDDLRVLIDGLGICLSSNQLSDVLGKINTSKYLHYRDLTDKEMTDVDINNIMNTEISEDFDYIKELAMGNKALFDDETVSTDAMMNDEEIDRLRNELDKSERCRQILELKISEIKDETERSCSISKTQAKDIAKLKSQEAEYRNKYHSEKHRGDRYKRDFERLFQQLKDVDKMTNDVNKFVANIVVKFTKNPEKDQSSSSKESKKVSNKTSIKKSITIEESNADPIKDHDKLDECYDFELREVIEIEDEVNNSEDIIDETMDNEKSNNESSINDKDNDAEDGFEINDGENNNFGGLETNDLEANDDECNDIEVNNEVGDDLEASVEEGNDLEVNNEEGNDLEVNNEEGDNLEANDEESNDKEDDLIEKNIEANVEETDGNDIIEEVCVSISLEDEEVSVPISMEYEDCEQNTQEVNVIDNENEMCLDDITVEDEELCCQDTNITMVDESSERKEEEHIIINKDDEVRMNDKVSEDEIVSSKANKDDVTEVPLIDVDITEVGIRILEDPGMVILEDISLI